MVDPVVKEDVTEVELNGVGSFEHFMKAVKAHLNEEYTKTRISGADYANVYLGSLNSVLQQAIAFELGKGEAAQRAALVEAQVRLVEAEIIGQGKQNDLIDKQIEKIDAEITYVGFQNQLIQEQIEKMKNEADLVAEQILSMQKEREKTDAEIILLGFQGKKLEQDVLVAIQQVETAKKQVELIGQQVLLTEAQVEKTGFEADLIKQNAVNASKEYNLIERNILRVEEETELLKRKVDTEIAQIRDFVDDEAVAGIVGRKNTLYERQADGFLRDAEQKAAKILGDIWSLEKSQDPTRTPINEITGLEGDGEFGDAFIYIRRVIEKMLEGTSVETNPEGK